MEQQNKVGQLLFSQFIRVLPPSLPSLRDGNLPMVDDATSAQVTLESIHALIGSLTQQSSFELGAALQVVVQPLLATLIETLKHHEECRTALGQLVAANVALTSAAKIFAGTEFPALTPAAAAESREQVAIPTSAKSLPASAPSTDSSPAAAPREGSTKPAPTGVRKARAIKSWIEESSLHHQQAYSVLTRYWGASQEARTKAEGLVFTTQEFNRDCLAEGISVSHLGNLLGNLCKLGLIETVAEKKGSYRIMPIMEQVLASPPTLTPYTTPSNPLEQLNLNLPEGFTSWQQLAAFIASQPTNARPTQISFEDFATPIAAAKLHIERNEMHRIYACEAMYPPVVRGDPLRINPLIYSLYDQRNQGPAGESTATEAAATGPTSTPPQSKDTVPAEKGVIEHPAAPPQPTPAAAVPSPVADKAASINDFKVPGVEGAKLASLWASAKLLQAKFGLQPFSVQHAFNALDVASEEKLTIVVAIRILEQLCTGKLLIKEGSQYRVSRSLS